MASLKDLKSSIVSVNSTKRITSAMKMVASAKMKKATQNVEASKPYAQEMAKMINNLARTSSAKNPLLVGTGSNNIHLFIVVASDRGLCGGFNSNLVRQVIKNVHKLKKEGKTVKLLIVGRKASAVLKSKFTDNIVAVYEDLNKPAPTYQHAEKVGEKIIAMANAGEFDICTLYYNEFINVLQQTPTPKQIIPLVVEPAKPEQSEPAKTTKAVYEYEPNEEAILKALLPKNIITQIYSVMLESFAGEQAARMTAMDNATNNAGEMIRTLQIKYNRTRQAQITGELIEIISGAEAL